MRDLIFMAGAPGSGKTTISKMMQKKLGFPPLVDFGNLRVLHLDDTWSNQSKDEEQMSFENLSYVLKNYVRHGYKNVIVNDLQDFRIREVPRRFQRYDFLILTLVVDDDAELERRVLGERDSGFRNVSAALEWNHQLLERKLLRNEFKISNTHRDPAKTVKKILELL